MVASLIAIYWFQPSSSIRNLDFWFSTVAIWLTVLTWVITRSTGTESKRATLFTGLLLILIIMMIGLTRYIEPLCCITATHPPTFSIIASVLGAMTALVLLVNQIRGHQKTSSGIAILLILAIFIIIKSPPLAHLASVGWRHATGQSTALAGSRDIIWLGFSYLAFRLLHVLRDFQNGKLPAFSLLNFLNYAVFFPAYQAGPIDRAQRFIAESKENNLIMDSSGWRQKNLLNTMRGFERILIGLFKKFVIADTLAIIALNPTNAIQTVSTFWAWVLLVSFSLRLYFDFSGYTDIAIGLGQIMGWHLPENFARPYLKQNLTLFWNGWHMTLAGWFRAYYFNPVTRWMRTRRFEIPAWIIILVGQFTTMVLIGLWHGITWNFFIWGAWHGIGLFIHNRWSEWTRPMWMGKSLKPVHQSLISVSGWLLTFGYVTLGWVWFALPTPELSLKVFKILAGE